MSEAQNKRRGRLPSRVSGAGSGRASFQRTQGRQCQEVALLPGGTCRSRKTFSEQLRAKALGGQQYRPAETPPTPRI